MAETAIHTFGAAYGRMCVLVAGGIISGRDQEKMLEASRGQGYDLAALHTELRRQRGRVNRALAQCSLCNVEMKETLNRAREIRAAVQQEFNCRIPVM